MIVNIEFKEAECNFKGLYQIVRFDALWYGRDHSNRYQAYNSGIVVIRMG